MAIGPSKGPAVLANGFEPATAPFVVHLMDGTVSLQCQAHQQLRAAQIRPAMGSVVQRVGEVISLGHEMPRASGGHCASVAPASARDTPWVERLLQLEAEDSGEVLTLQRAAYVTAPRAPSGSGWADRRSRSPRRRS